MSMIAPEVADSGASSLGISKGSSKLGLLGAAQPAKTNHPYIVGLSLVVIGGLSLVGSITGTLPSMIAALFVPNALVDASSNTPAAPNELSYLAKASEGIATAGLIGGNPISNIGKFLKGLIP